MNCIWHFVINMPSPWPANEDLMSSFCPYIHRRSLLISPVQLNAKRADASKAARVSDAAKLCPVSAENSRRPGK